MRECGSKGAASMDNMNDTRHMLKNTHPSFSRKVPPGWLSTSTSRMLRVSDHIILTL
jgi:hypothetical protein